MNIKERVRHDLWKAIHAHYEREDYTEAVRDSIFHMSEVLREKSGIEDKDGTKLVDTALLGNNPAILINKNETTTEKDIQQGIGFAFKGIMQSVRNPLSHECFQYTRDESEVIILYINFLLNQIDKSGGNTKIDNIVELLFDDDFTDTKEYAALLLKEVPTKKRYDLLLELYQKREDLPKYRLKYFLTALFESLTKAAKSDFIRVVSSSLMKCKDDNNLRMYFHYFMLYTYREIDRLAQLRIENLIIKSIKAGKIVLISPFDTDDSNKKCNSEGSLSTWISDKIYLLSNQDKIMESLFYKLDQQPNEQEFVFRFFGMAITKNAECFTVNEISIIKKQLECGSKLFFDWLSDTIEILKDEKYIELFGAEYEECKKVIELDSMLPF